MVTHKMPEPCATLYYAQGFLPNLLADLERAFPKGEIYTPRDHAAARRSVWPSTNKLVAAGKRVILVSSEDYGPGMAHLIFSKGHNAVGGPPSADILQAGPA